MGQVAILIGTALLFAQLINLALILNERQKLSLAENQGPAITRFTSAVADLDQAAPEFRSAVLLDRSRRGLRLSVGATSNVADGARREESVERRLTSSLADAGLRRGDLRASFVTAVFPRRDGSQATSRALLLSVQRADGNWVNGRVMTPPPDPFLPLRLGGATISLFLIVLGVSLLIARRLVQPLSELARSAEQFRRGNLAEPVTSRGPADLRRAIDAFNAMNMRVANLLIEKDLMLGAIGHDLRTPLASLRIRVENVEPDEERHKQTAMIDQIGAMLEDILFLARTGHAQEVARPVDMAALADAVVEEYRALGRPVTLESSDEATATIQPNLVRRAIRNLIDNALAYGHVARVAVQAGADITISVTDDGPGLAEDQLDAALDPFVRGERSRNRSSGGSGLGLAITRSVAEGLGGRVTLANREGGGLVAGFVIPGGEPVTN
jgi:signal transduction histidine kinase